MRQGERRCIQVDRPSGSEPLAQVAAHVEPGIWLGGQDAHRTAAGTAALQSPRSEITLVV